ncbi:MAG: SIR2 family NAD-dependent protein deacylase [Propylenella sp.]
MQRDVSGNGEFLAFRRLIDAATCIVALTGAGISTESGIPDFRSPGGIWTRMKPITFQEFVASEEARMEDWRRRFVMNEAFAAAAPNAGHRGLVRLAEEGRLAAVITQNIDGLHQRAGLAPERLIEIHGNSTRGRCIGCVALMELEAVRRIIDATGASPRCACGGLVKAAIISFGERVPSDALEAANRLAEAADLFIVLGSSLQVQPAAMLPVVAKHAGAALAIVNREATPLDAHADVVLHRPIGSVFAAIYPQLVN